MDVGTPDAGTTQAAGSTLDSSTYSSYEEMVAAYAEDIAEMNAGDSYGKNIVDLYNPLNYIGAEDTENPSWIRILMGAAEGDMSMFSSLNLQIAFLSAGVDANIEWQWDGGHVPSEVLSESFALADAAAYRTKGASKAIPGFDVIDYGQEDYVFGSSEKDARHWNSYLLKIFEEHAEELEPLFHAGASSSGTSGDTP